MNNAVLEQYQVCVLFVTPTTAKIVAVGTQNAVMLSIAQLKQVGHTLKWNSSKLVDINEVEEAEVVESIEEVNENES